MIKPSHASILDIIGNQWFGQFFDEKVPFSEIGIMDNQVNDTPHTERRH